MRRILVMLSGVLCVVVAGMVAHEGKLGWEWFLAAGMGLLLIERFGRS